MLMLPALPPVAALVPIEMDPLVPELAVPELNTSTPLAPAFPAFAVVTNREPLELKPPAPLEISTFPPARSPEAPASRTSRPPAPLLPLPTVILTRPPFPKPATPVPIETDPDVPELDVPELNSRAPLVP
jgi:hypothetical protein